MVRMKPDAMLVSLKNLFVPVLRERGLKGSFPHFRRLKNDQIDLLTIQFDRHGGGFVIEISKCPPDGVTTTCGKQIPPNKVTAWDMNNRHRLGAPVGGDHWFRFDDGTPTDQVANSAVSHLEEADVWWSRK